MGMGMGMEMGMEMGRMALTGDDRTVVATSDDLNRGSIVQ